MNTVRLKPETQERLRRLAREQGVTVSDVHRAAIEEYLDRTDMARPNGNGVNQTASRWDDLIGVVEGIDPNLSSRTREVFEEILMEKHDRHSH